MATRSRGATWTLLAGVLALALAWATRLAAENADGWDAFPYILLSRLILLPSGLALVAAGAVWWFLSWPGPGRQTVK